MELKISERKKKSIMRLRKWAFVLMACGFLLAAAVRTALMASCFDWLPEWIKNMFAFFICGGGCFLLAFIFITRAQKAKTQQVFIGQNLLYVVHIRFKSETTGATQYDSVITKEIKCITVISPECGVKVNGSKIKFFGKKLIKRKELIKETTYKDYLKQIAENEYSDTLKSAKGTYREKEFMLRILKDDEEQKLLNFFGSK